MRLHLATACALLLLVLLRTISSMAQDERKVDSAWSRPTMAASPVVRNLPACFEGENEAFESLPKFDRFWLSEDVVFIITPQERCVILKLSTDEERDQFIEQFWYRRSPNPESFRKCI